MFLKLPPLKYLFVSGVISLLAILISLLVVLELPRIGIELDVASNGQLRISHVYPGSPASEAGVLPGSELYGLSKDGVQFLSLSHSSISQDPDVFSTFEQLNRFLTHIQNINDIVSTNSFYLKVSHDDVLYVSKTYKHQIAWLPGWYWWMLVLGSFIFLFAGSILGHDLSNLSARHLFITGVGLWVASIVYTAYGCRELAGVGANAFYNLVALKHLALCIFAWGGTTLIWQYPRKQKVGFFYWGYTMLLFVIWLANTFQIIQFPVHAYYLAPYLLPTVVGIYFTLKQYQAARSSPIDKAIMLWICSAIWVSILTIYLLHILPVLYNQKPISNLVVQFMFFCLFVGFGFGVTKYRLFDIDRWWFNTWLIFFLGVCILSIDALVVYLWKLSAQKAFSVALLMSFWIYFPLREKLWKMLFQKKRTYEVNDYLAEIISLFSSGGAGAVDARKYTKLFSFIFKPSNIRVISNQNESVTEPSIHHNGLDLLIPIDGNQALHLSGKDLGNHLFDSNDRGFSEAAMSFAKKVVDLGESSKKAEANERARIMRDLHDDVGSQLLHLIHGSMDPKSVKHAQDILNSLRLSVIPLHDNRSRNVSDSVDAWVLEIKERLMDVNIHLADTLKVDFDACLGVREYINATRILRELTTNLIKHSDTSSVKMIFTIEGRYLNIQYDQYENVCDPKDFDPGTGMNNIDSRINEIKGRCDVSVLRVNDMATVRFTLLIPLEVHCND